MVQFLDVRRDEYVVGIDCRQYEKLDYHTNESFYAMVDRLSGERERRVTKTQFKLLEKTLGLNYQPDGLLWDTRLRTVLRPVDNCIRDWMHTTVSGGIAGTEMRLVIATLVGRGVTLTSLVEYASCFHLPRVMGRIEQSWFTERRLSGDNLRSFASEQLCMIPILHRFLRDIVEPMGIMVDDIRCFAHLATIVDLLSLGPVGAMPHVAELRQAILNHHELYATLYPAEAIKPKWHHLLHIPENMSTVGRLLSCFVTERKHRITKKAALYVFRHFEATVLKDLINKQVHDFVDSNLFKAAFLMEPSTVDIGGYTVRTSVAAMLSCGEVHRGDIVATRDHRVGKVSQFWAACDGSIILAIAVYPPAPGVDSFWVGQALAFVADNGIVRSAIWCERSPGLIRIVPPIHW